MLLCFLLQTEGQRRGLKWRRWLIGNSWNEVINALSGKSIYLLKACFEFQSAELQSESFTASWKDEKHTWTGCLAQEFQKIMRSSVKNPSTRQQQFGSLSFNSDELSVAVENSSIFFYLCSPSYSKHNPSLTCTFSWIWWDSVFICG